MCRIKNQRKYVVVNRATNLSYRRIYRFRDEIISIKLPRRHFSSSIIASGESLSQISLLLEQIYRVPVRYSLRKYKSFHFKSNQGWLFESNDITPRHFSEFIAIIVGMRISRARPAQKNCTCARHFGFSTIARLVSKVIVSRALWHSLKQVALRLVKVRHRFRPAPFARSLLYHPSPSPHLLIFSLRAARCLRHRF